MFPALNTAIVTAPLLMAEQQKDTLGIYLCHQFIYPCTGSSFLIQTRFTSSIQVK